MNDTPDNTLQPGEISKDKGYQHQVEEAIISHVYDKIHWWNADMDPSMRTAQVETFAEVTERYGAFVEPVLRFFSDNEDAVKRYTASAAEVTRDNRNPASAAETYDWLVRNFSGRNLRVIETTDSSIVSQKNSARLLSDGTGPVIFIDKAVVEDSKVRASKELMHEFGAHALIKMKTDQTGESDPDLLNKNAYIKHDKILGTQTAIIDSMLADIASQIRTENSKS